MKRFQGFLIGIFVTLVIVGSVPNFADTINVVFNSINLRINGVQVAKKGDQFTLDNGSKVPFSIVYKGTTYLPLKKVASLLDKNILWDGATNTVSVNDEDFVEEEVPTTQNNSENSRFNPSDSNVTQHVVDTLYTGDSFELDLTLTEIIRGEEAWQMIHDANQFNDQPDSSSEIILAKFSAAVTYASNRNLQYDLYNMNFDLVSQDGKDYEFESFVMPEPPLDSKLYEGASNEGWVAFVVKKSDIKPLIVYGKSYDGTGGIWFKGYSK